MSSDQQGSVGETTTSSGRSSPFSESGLDGSSQRSTMCRPAASMVCYAVSRLLRQHLEISDAERPLNGSELVAIREALCAEDSKIVDVLRSIVDANTPPQKAPAEDKKRAVPPTTNTEPSTPAAPRKRQPTPIITKPHSTPFREDPNKDRLSANRNGYCAVDILSAICLAFDKGDCRPVDFFLRYDLATDGDISHDELTSCVAELLKCRLTDPEIEILYTHLENSFDGVRLADFLHFFDPPKSRTFTYKSVNTVTTVTLSPDGRRVACGDMDMKVFVFRTSDCELIKAMKFPKAVGAVVLGDEGVGVGCFNPGHLEWTYQVQGDVVESATFRTDSGRRASRGSRDFTDPASSEIGEGKSHGSNVVTWSMGSDVNSLALNDVDAELVVGSGHKVTIFSLTTREPIYEFDYGGVVWGVATARVDVHDLELADGTKIEAVTSGVELESACTGDWPLWCSTSEHAADSTKAQMLQEAAETRRFINDETVNLSYLNSGDSLTTLFQSAQASPNPPLKSLRSSHTSPLLLKKRRKMGQESKSMLQSGLDILGGRSKSSVGLQQQLQRQMRSSRGLLDELVTPQSPTSPPQFFTAPPTTAGLGSLDSILNDTGEEKVALEKKVMPRRRSMMPILGFMASTPAPLKEEHHSHRKLGGREMPEPSESKHAEVIYVDGVLRTSDPLGKNRNVSALLLERLDSLPVVAVFAVMAVLFLALTASPLTQMMANDVHRRTTNRGNLGTTIIFVWEVMLRMTLTQQIHHSLKMWWASPLDQIDAVVELINLITYIVVSSADTYGVSERAEQFLRLVSLLRALRLGRFFKVLITTIQNTTAVEKLETYSVELRRGTVINDISRWNLLTRHERHYIESREIALRQLEDEKKGEVKEEEEFDQEHDGSRSVPTSPVMKKNQDDDNRAMPARRRSHTMEASSSQSSLLLLPKGMSEADKEHYILRHRSHLLLYARQPLPQHVVNHEESQRTSHSSRRGIMLSGERSSSSSSSGFPSTRNGDGDEEERYEDVRIKTFGDLLELDDPHAAVVDPSMIAELINSSSRSVDEEEEGLGDCLEEGPQEDEDDIVARSRHELMQVLRQEARDKQHLPDRDGMPVKLRVLSRRRHTETRKYVAFGGESQTIDLWSYDASTHKPMASAVKRGSSSSNKKDDGGTPLQSSEQSSYGHRGERTRMTSRIQCKDSVTRHAYKELVTTFDHNVNSVSLSADASRLAGSDAMGNVMVYDVVDRCTIFRSKLSDLVWSVSLSASGDLVAYGGASKELHVTDVDTGAKVLRKRMGDRIRSISLSSDGEVIVCGGFDFAMYLTSVRQGAVSHSADLGSTVRSVSLDREGSKLAVGSDDSCIRFFDVSQQANGGCVQCLDTPLWTARHKSKVWIVAVSPDGKQVAAGDYSNAVIIYDAPTGAILWQKTRWAPGKPPFTWGLAYSGDSRRLAIGHWDNFAYVVDATNLVEMCSAKRDDRVYSVAMNDDGKLLAVGGRDKCVALYRVVDVLSKEDGELLPPQYGEVSMPSTPTSTSKTMNDSPLVKEAVGEVVGWEMVLEWNLKQPAFVYAVALSFDGSRLAIGRVDTHMDVYSVATQTKTHSIVQGGVIQCVQFPPRSADQVAIAGEQKAVSVWGLGQPATPKATQLLQLPRHATCHSVAMSENGIAYGAGSIVSLYGRGGAEATWQDRPSFEVAAEILAHPDALDTMLSQHPAILNAQKPHTGESLLQYAVRKKGTAVIDRLLNSNCSHGLLSDSNAMTALTVAVANERREIVRRLLMMAMENADRSPLGMRAVIEMAPTVGEKYPDVLLDFIRNVKLTHDKALVPIGRNNAYLSSRTQIVTAGAEERSPHGLWDPLLINKKQLHNPSHFARQGSGRRSNGSIKTHHRIHGSMMDTFQSGLTNVKRRWFLRTLPVKKKKKKGWWNFWSSREEDSSNHTTRYAFPIVSGPVDPTLPRPTLPPVSPLDEAGTKRLAWDDETSPTGSASNVTFAGGSARGLSGGGSQRRREPTRMLSTKNSMKNMFAGAQQQMQRSNSLRRRRSSRVNKIPGTTPDATASPPQDPEHTHNATEDDHRQLIINRGRKYTDLLERGFSGSGIKKVEVAALRVPFEACVGRAQYTTYLSLEYNSLLSLVVRAASAQADYRVYDSLVIRSIIQFKWDHYASRIFQIQFAVCVLHLGLVFTMYVSMVETAHLSWRQIKPSDDEERDATSGHETTRILLLLTYGPSMFLSLSLLLLELRQYLVEESVGAVDWVKLNDMMCYATQLFIDFFVGFRYVPDAIRIIATFNTLQLCFRILIFARGFDTWGPLVRMMTKMVIEVRHFMHVVVFMILAFSASFSVLTVTPPNLWLTLWLLNNGLYMKEEPVHDTQVPTNGSTFFFLLVLSVFISLLLLNLLIAIMNSAYDEVKRSSEVEVLFEKSRIIIDVERLWLPLITKKDTIAYYFPKWLLLLVPLANLDPEAYPHT